MNELLLSLGLSDWKPLLTTLLLPPVPWLLLVLLGARWLSAGRPVGWLAVVPAAAGIWFGSTAAVADALSRALLAPPQALGLAEVAGLRQAVAASPGATAIVVLGSGRETLAPEYAVSNLSPRAMERLRYGIWLGRETGAPLAYSGGVGHAQRGQVSEAEVAARIAADEFTRPLKWLEGQSRDTRENASMTIAIVRPAGVKRLVVVTHGWHMPRAMNAFTSAAQRSGGNLEIVAAPMGMALSSDRPVLRWLPSSDGMVRTRDVLREWLGKVAGA